MMIATAAGFNNIMLTHAKRKAGIPPNLPSGPIALSRYGYSAPDWAISVPSSAYDRAPIGKIDKIFHN